MYSTGDHTLSLTFRRNTAAYWNQSKYRDGRYCKTSSGYNSLIQIPSNSRPALMAS